MARTFHKLFKKLSFGPFSRRHSAICLSQNSENLLGLQTWCSRPKFITLTCNANYMSVVPLPSPRLQNGPRIFNTSKPAEHLCSRSVRRFHQKVLSNKEIQTKRLQLFEKEAKRQESLITDIEKIEVHYHGFPGDCTLMMNKDLSTPYNCAQHISQLILERSVVAEVDGEIWDMFRPLISSCTLRYLHFKEADPYYVNKAFWRSLSLMLGAVLESTFKDDVPVLLCSFPAPQVRSGSFVYDFSIPLTNWKPTQDELRVFSTEIVKLALANKPFHRLEVDAKLALRMFEDNVYKKAQIPHIAAQSKSGTSVVLYKVGDFIDISRGPTISHTGHVGKCTITTVLPTETDSGLLYRIQGVALPKGFHLNHYSYSILEERARKLNPGRVPSIDAFHKEVTLKQFAMQE